MVDVPGATEREPEAGKVPNPAIVTSVALVVCQVRVVDWPCSIVLGFAARVAVGVTGAGGGAAGVAFATFFAQPADNNTTASTATKEEIRNLSWANLFVMVISSDDVQTFVNGDRPADERSRGRCAQTLKCANSRNHRSLTWNAESNA